jgi:hypothetical protein
MKGKKVFGAILTGLVLVLTLALLILTFCGVKFATFTLIGVVVHYILSTVLHELGHIIVAKSRNCEIVEWSILGLGYSKLTKKLTYSIKSYAGNVSFISKNPDRAESDLLAVSISGIVATLIYLATCIVLGLVIFNFYSFSIMLSASYITAYMLVINTIAINNDTDGAVFFGLKKGKIEYRATENLAKIISWLYNGKTPAEISKGLFLYKDGLNGQAVEYYLMLSYIEKKEYALAYDIACEYSQDYPSQFLPEKLYLALLMKNNAVVEEIGETALEVLNPNSVTYFRISALYRRYKGELDWAEICEKSALKANKEQFIKGLNRLEEKLINQN